MKSFCLFFLLVCPLWSHNVDHSKTSLAKVDFEQNLGAPLPRDLAFVDANGSTEKLSYYLNSRPTVLVLAYADCPNLCSLVIDGVIKVLRDIPLATPRDYSVVVLSLNPNETLPVLKQQKKLFVDRLGNENNKSPDAGVHFLRAEKSSIDKVADPIGFKYFYDAKQKQYAHPSGFVVINPEGKVFQYFYGIRYSADVVAKALREARGGSQGSLAQKILLYCFHFDPAESRWGATIVGVMRVAAILLLAVLSVVFFRRRRR